MTFYVTPHAVDRYIERVDPVSRDVAMERILGSAHAIDVAVAFGARVVRLGNGAKLIIDKRKVITVIPRSWIGAGHRRPQQEAA